MEENKGVNSKNYKTGNDVIDYALELDKLEKKFHGKDNLLGITALTIPAYISSNRAVMLASNLKQFKTLKYKELPRLRTNYEDVAGEHSSYLHRAKADCEVVAIIDKFAFAPKEVYYLVLYSKELDKYFLEIKKQGVEMQERFGFHINTDNMDKLEVGDKIPKGFTLWKSNSYDENDMYGYGINARCTWMCDCWTHEDAIRIRKGFADRCIAFEEETVEVTVNDNDYFINIYGDDEQYLGFPDVGSFLKTNMVCVLGKKNNSRLLYDMKEANLREVNSLEHRIYYAKFEHNAKVWNIDIFCNKSIDEIPYNKHNAQIIKYIKNQQRFYTELNGVLGKIIKSGSKYDDDIGFWFKRSSDMLNPKTIFRKENSFPNYFHIKFQIEREVGIDIGNKLVGRYGNKGVVSIIVPDEEMPFTVDEYGNKRPLDIIFNTLGIPNRLISMPLYEVEFTGSADKIRRMLDHIESIEEKEKLFFHFMSFFNDRGMFSELCDYYLNLNEKKKKEFWESVSKDGIYIHIPPMWEKEYLYDRLKRLYKEIPECNPKEDVFINKFGREIKMMNKLVVGEQYILVLKQSSKKGFSARSLGFINNKGLPDKTDRVRNNQSFYSGTPIKNGIDDCNNLSIGVPSNEIAKFHLMYRNSVIGRREWSKLLTENPLDIDDIKLKPEFTNRNVEILNALLMCKGQGILFPGDTIYVGMDTDEVESFLYDNKVFLYTAKEMRDVLIRDYFKDKFNEKMIVGDKEFVDKCFDEYIEHQMNKRKQDMCYVYIKDDIIYD
jgi:DNA-directed RNA polymerase beta subunit